MTLIRTLTRVALFTTLAGAATLSLAQSAASAAKKELVQKALQLQQADIEGLARTIATQSVAQMGQQAGVMLQNRVAPEQREALAKDIQADFKKYGDEVVPLLRDKAVKLAPSTMGTMMEERLSEDELKQIIAALESPAFRKYLQMAPELQRTLAQKIVAETQAQVEPKLKALEQSLSKKLNAAAASAPATGPAAAPKAAGSGAKK